MDNDFDEAAANRASDLFDVEIRHYRERLQNARDADEQFAAITGLYSFISDSWDGWSADWHVPACISISEFLYQLPGRGAAWIWLEKTLQTKAPAIRDSDAFQYVCLVPIIEEPVIWDELGRLLSCGLNDHAATCIMQAYRIAEAEQRILSDLDTCFASNLNLMKMLKQQYLRAIEITDDNEKQRPALGESSPTDLHL